MKKNYFYSNGRIIPFNKVTSVRLTDFYRQTVNVIAPEVDIDITVDAKKQHDRYMEWLNEQ